MMLQTSIAQRQMKAQIHSFPTMYILGGVDVVEMGQIKVFYRYRYHYRGTFPVPRRGSNLGPLGWPPSTLTTTLHLG